MLARQLRNSYAMYAQMQRSFAVKVGDKLPAISVPVIRHTADGFVHEAQDIAEYTKDRHVVVVGYPGAFTPTCMATHIPDYINNADKLKSQGVDEVLAMSVNDPFVVKAFADHLGGKDKINFIADGNGELTSALGLEFDLSAAHLAKRGVRMSMVIKDNVVVEVNNENGPGLTEVSGCSTLLKN